MFVSPVLASGGLLAVLEAGVGDGIPCVAWCVKRETPYLGRQIIFLSRIVATRFTTLTAAKTITKKTSEVLEKPVSLIFRALRPHFRGVLVLSASFQRGNFVFATFPKGACGFIENILM